VSILETKPTSTYSEVSNDQTLKLLRTSTAGLGKSEAEARANESGYNEVAEGKKSPLLDFLRFFWGPMLTGDNLAIAQEIAQEVSIGNKIHHATEIADLNENEKTKIIEESDGFAEVYPEDKYSILKLLQSNSDIVGMTGDGVNDSPALKQAEVGIAVKDSSDVAKASASIVLTEPGMRVIIDAIKVSRQIYRRVLTWFFIKVTGVIQLVGLLTIGYFWLHGILMSILGMVLLVFGRDFTGMSLATDNATPASKPNVWNLKNITLASLALGIPLVIEGLIIVFIGIAYFHLNLIALQTYVMLILLFTSQTRNLIVRDRQHFWASRPGNALMISSILTTVAFALIGIYGILVPALTTYEVLVVLTLSIGLTLILDIPKHYVFQRFGF
jgi:H+-transporting ATPase